MKKSIIYSFILALCICLIYSCTNSVTKKEPNHKEITSATVVIKNSELHTILDSFSKLNLSFSAKCVPTIGYLKIIETRDNHEMKLLIQSYEINSPYLKKLYFDETFKINDYPFFMVQNTNHYFDKNDIEKNIRQAIEKEIGKTSNKTECGSEFTWLVHFSGKSIDTISYRATSPFEAPCIDCNEWGDLSRTYIKSGDSLKRIKL